MHQMPMSSYHIRTERGAEYHDVEMLVREAFWNVYRPGCTEHFIVHCLRSDPDYLPEMHFVMEVDGQPMGQALYMKSYIHHGQERTPVATLGPISIHPTFQRRGLGRILLDSTLHHVLQNGFGAVCLEGNIDFYGGSGFVTASEYGIHLKGWAKDSPSPYFLCRELQFGYLRGVHGEYVIPRGYYIDESLVDGYDRNFPYKKKLKLPTQLGG